MQAIVHVILLSSLINSFRCYRNNSDAREVSSLFDDSEESRNSFIREENLLFERSGVCRAQNISTLQECSSLAETPIRKLRQLGGLACYCDSFCHVYGDCCIDRVGRFDDHGDDLTCRKVIGTNGYRIPIYVIQRCPKEWEDDLTREFCEMEAEDRASKNLIYNHLQDLPVLSEVARKFYRNIYCAICNGDYNVVKWETHLYCNGSPNASTGSFEDTPDFSGAVYVPRTQNYRGVKIHGKSRNCRIIVNNFNLERLVTEYNGRLCKDIIKNCSTFVDTEASRKCKLYTSFVYDATDGSQKRKVFKNFHCAKCHDVPVENLSCIDPYSIPILYTPITGKLGLSMLFDFNFLGDGSGSSCNLADGKMWDPIFRSCQNITCGVLYKRQGSKCIPIRTAEKNQGLKNDCIKQIINKDLFTVLKDGEIFVNSTYKIYSLPEFEVVERNGKEVIQVAICLHSEDKLLPITNAHYWLSVITLSISIICLILHLAVYALFKTLRNCPGKVLMCLATSLLCGHFSLLLGPHLVDFQWLCYLSGVIMHFGYIAGFMWMSVMAFDLNRTFSRTQSRGSYKNKVFIKYSAFAWLLSVCIITTSILLDNVLSESNKFRPRYGDPVCWFNNRYGLLLFFAVPVALLLLANVILFTKTALRLREISRQTKAVSNFSEKMRYFLYLKLSIVLGLTWILGFVAGLTNINAFWYPFIILNGLQGALIFIAFSLKRNIMNMLAIKFKLRSSKYRIRQRTGIKAAMYTSLSNLSSWQTTTSSSEILKSVRKINPDTVKT